MVVQSQFHNSFDSQSVRSSISVPQVFISSIRSVHRVFSVHYFHSDHQFHQVIRLSISGPPVYRPTGSSVHGVRVFQFSTFSPTVYSVFISFLQFLVSFSSAHQPISSSDFGFQVSAAKNFQSHLISAFRFQSFRFSVSIFSSVFQLSACQLVSFQFFTRMSQVSVLQCSAISLSVHQLSVFIFQPALSP